MVAPDVAQVIVRRDSLRSGFDGCVIGPSVITGAATVIGPGGDPIPEKSARAVALSSIPDLRA
jgi:hypothetical protein